MRLKKVLIGIVLVLFFASPLFLSAKVTEAQDQSTDQSAVLSKLDQVLNSQKILMDEMAAMKQELNTIKIRVTQAQ